MKLSVTFCYCVQIFLFVHSFYAELQKCVAKSELDFLYKKSYYIKEFWKVPQLYDFWSTLKCKIFLCHATSFQQIAIPIWLSVEYPLLSWQTVEVAINRGDRLYLVADSANASAISQLALTRVNRCVDIPSLRCYLLDQSI